MNSNYNSIVKSFLDQEGTRIKPTTSVSQFYSDLNDKLNFLNASAYEYVDKYDKYIYDNLLDASLLKDKLKDAVIKVSKNAKL